MNKHPISHKYSIYFGFVMSLNNNPERERESVAGAFDERLADNNILLNYHMTAGGTFESDADDCHRQDHLDDGKIWCGSLG